MLIAIYKGTTFITEVQDPSLSFCIKQKAKGYYLIPVIKGNENE